MQAYDTQIECLNWLTKEREYQTMKWGDFEQHPQSTAGYLIIVESLLNEAKEHWMKGHETSALIRLAKLSAVALASMEQNKLPLKHTHNPIPGGEGWRHWKLP